MNLGICTSLWARSFRPAQSRQARVPQRGRLPLKLVSVPGTPCLFCTSRFHLLPLPVSSESVVSRGVQASDDVAGVDQEGWPVPCKLVFRKLISPKSRNSIVPHFLSRPLSLVSAPT